MGVKMKKFKVKKVLDQGASNPIVARILLQFSEMLSSGIDLPSTKKKEIVAILIDCMKDLLFVEEKIEKYSTIEKEAIKAVKENFRINPGNCVDSSFDDPTIELQCLFEEILIRAIMCVRRLRRIAALIFDRDFKKGNSIKTFLLEGFKEHKDLLKFIEHNESLIQELYDIRGMIEHEELEISPFDVIIENNNPFIVLPSLRNGIVLHEYLKQTLKHVFNYIEQTTLVMFSLKLFPRLEIIELNDEESKKRNGVRYSLGLSV